MHEPAVIVADLRESSREQWLEVRRSGLGSSDAPAVLAWSPWVSPWALWLDKTGIVADDEPKEAMFFGNHLEPAIAEAFTERTGWLLDNPQRTYAHPEHGWMLASPDRLIPNPEGGHWPRDLGLLEIKNVSAYKADEWQGGKPDHEGVIRGGEAPAMYLAQVQHQHAVLGTTWGYLCSLLGGNRLCIVEVPRDDEFIDMLIAAEEGFWHDHVLANVPPPMDGQESTTEALTRLFAESDPEGAVELDDGVVSALAAYREASAAERAAKEAKAEAGNVLRDTLGEAEQGTYRGVPVVTWRAPRPKQEIDEDALRSDFPEIAEKVTRTVPQNRRISVARSKAAQELIESLSTDGGHHGQY